MEYWIYLNEQKRGPYSLGGLMTITIPPTTLVWREGLSEWVEAKELEELAPLFNRPEAVQPPPFVAETVEGPKYEEASTADEEPTIVEDAEETSEESTVENSENETTEQPEEDYAEYEEESTSTATPPHFTSTSYDSPQQPNSEVPASSEPMPECPPSYLVWAILSTLCCCQIFGIIAIFFAANVKPKYNRGDYEGAKKNSERAALWVILSFVIGLVTIPLQMVINML